LITNIVGLLQSTEVEEVLPTEVWVHFLCNKGIESIQHGEMIAILMYELFLGCVGLNLSFSGTMENIWYT
jgi:hypothetical protein